MQGKVSCGMKSRRRLLVCLVALTVLVAVFSVWVRSAIGQPIPRDALHS
jgi:hypothetical protein